VTNLVRMNVGKDSAQITKEIAAVSHLQSVFGSSLKSIVMKRMQRTASM
jgi:hypothetical protein